MTEYFRVHHPPRLPKIKIPTLPQLFLDAGGQACRRTIEFLTANIPNPNTRDAYARAVLRFARWCEHRQLTLAQLQPYLIAAYIEDLGKLVSAPTVKLHLAALRQLFDYLVVGQVMPTNPASAVRGPKHVVKRGLTPVLTPKEARLLLRSIDTTTLAGLRDRALIATMIYSFARVTATISMNTEDYFPQGPRRWFRLHEKGGKRHSVPAHHKAEEYMDAYLLAAGVATAKGTPLFRVIDHKGQVTERRLTRQKALKMVKRRVRAAGLPSSICNHSFRATGITTYLLNGGTLEHAQQIACHESPRTTKLYDRTTDEVSLDEIERIII